MFTQLEKREQKRLKSANADLYTIDVSNEATQGLVEVKVYAESEGDAILLARRISKRTERDLLTDLNFDIREIKQNKLGLILPWKDPVNKRSVNSSIKMPLKRSKNIIKDIISASTGRNRISVAELSQKQILDMKTACMKSNFVSLILFIAGIYILIVSSPENMNFLSAGLCLVVSITTLVKTRKSMEIITTEEVSRNNMESVD
jgi:hypothetical protein